MISLKKLVVFAVFCFTSISVQATEFGDSFVEVKRAECTSDKGFIKMDLEAQELTGKIPFEDGRILELSFEKLKGEDPDYKVSLYRNFLESGLDILGGPVVSSDEESFGTYSIVLNKMKDPTGTQEMTVSYLEAMTGFESSLLMTCHFE